MSTRTLHIAALVPFVMLAACGGAPQKTAQMQSYEQMRRSDDAKIVEQRYPELARAAAHDYARARDALDDDDRGLVRHYTYMATATWRTAAARSARQDAEESLTASRNRQQQLLEEVAQTERRVEEGRTAVARLERISDLEQKVAATESAMQGQGKAAAAREAINHAMDAIRRAEQMNAAQFAAVPLEQAHTLLDQASSAVEAQSFAMATKQAKDAQRQAELAIEQAGPEYERMQASQDVDRKNREILETAAHNIPGSEPRIVQRGVIVTLRGLFGAGDTTLTSDKYGVVQQVAELARQHPEYTIMVEGHTDNQGAAHQNLILSQGRAQAIVSQLVQAGVAPNEINSVGLGEEQPIADNRTAEGRNQNRRVDVIFVAPRREAMVSERNRSRPESDDGEHRSATRPD